MSKVLNTVLAALVISSAASLAIPSITLAASNSGGQSSGPSGGGNDGGGGDGGNGDGKEPLRLIGPGPGVQRAQIPPNYPPRDPEPKYVEREADNFSCVYLYNQITRTNMFFTVPRYKDCLRRHGVTVQ